MHTEAVEAHPIDGANPLLQEALRRLVEGVQVSCLGKQHIDAPEVRLPVKDGVLVIDTLVVDVQLVEVLCIYEVVLVASSLQITKN